MADSDVSLREIDVLEATAECYHPVTCRYISGETRHSVESIRDLMPTLRAKGLMTVTDFQLTENARAYDVTAKGQAVLEDKST